VDVKTILFEAMRLNVSRVGNIKWFVSIELHRTVTYFLASVTRARLKSRSLPRKLRGSGFQLKLLPMREFRERRTVNSISVQDPVGAIRDTLKSVLDSGLSEEPDGGSTCSW